jgi:ArsR family transcriptional regulator, arsenate/arsenite/antimonite-responsive transcriptional repressor
MARTALPLIESPAESAADVCCPPLTSGVLSTAEASDLATLMKALADPARLRLLSFIQAQDGGEACVCDLTDPVQLTQPTVSHHLKILLDAGLVTRHKRGPWAYYRVVPERLAAIAATLTPGGLATAAR